MQRFLTQRLNNGLVELHEGASPQAGPSGVVVRSRASLISAGTERMLADFGRADLLSKVRRQPDRVAEVVTKVQTDGLAPTIDAIRSKLDTPIPLGYANAGIVTAVGPRVQGIRVGDLVATNGPHAEVVHVPSTLCAVAPVGVAAEHACFATVASVGLQGIRLANAQMGERFVVMGLGLIGLLTVQLLRAQGCAVLGIDIDERRMALARSFGAETAPAGDGAVDAAASFSQGRGVDGVLVCATTKSNEPIDHAALMCRTRGRIVLVGVAPLQLDRALFYEKELSFQVSCSYGPGRYDPTYETGSDYPFGFVRWTAGRNMQAVLDLVQSGHVRLDPLISHRFPFDDASAAYDALLGDDKALGIVLEYDDVAEDVAPQHVVVHATPPSSGGPARVAVIGAGNFANQVLLPAVVRAGGVLELIATRGGTDAAMVAERHGAHRSTTDLDAAVADENANVLVVATRHDSHASYVDSGLRAGKNVFVEKPLAIDTASLDMVVATLDELTAAGSLPLLGIGFNRRFAPITVRMVELLARLRVPKALVLTMNAGALPADHWTLDRSVGGGRIIGEAVHMVDLARHLVGAPIAEVTASYLDDATADTATILLGFGDGSVATVHYLANGSKRFAKERVEVFAGGRVLVNENFRTLRTYGFPAVRTMRLRRQDKGHEAGMRAFLDAVRSGGPPPIAIDEIIEVHKAVLAAAAR